MSGTSVRLKWKIKEGVSQSNEFYCFHHRRQRLWSLLHHMKDVVTHSTKTFLLYTSKVYCLHSPLHGNWSWHSNSSLLSTRKNFFLLTLHFHFKHFWPRIIMPVFYFVTLYLTGDSCGSPNHARWFKDSRLGYLLNQALLLYVWLQEMEDNSYYPCHQLPFSQIFSSWPRHLGLWGFESMCFVEKD